jgi:hypothetical protein
MFEGVGFTGDTHMDFTTALPDRSRYESAYGQLALLALCAVFMTAAIDEQLAAQATSGTAAMPLAGYALRLEKDAQTAHDRARPTRRRLCRSAANCSGPIYEADCVRCIDDSTAAAGELQRGPLLDTGELRA